MDRRHLYRRTKRLTVRALTLQDHEAWKNAHLSFSARRNVWDRENKTREQTTRAEFKKVLASQKYYREQDRYYDLSVFENATGKLVGTVAIMDVVRGLGQTAFIGYFINNTHWGRGYGKEAVLSVIDIAFRDLRLHRVEAGVEPTNRRSILLARSVGLRKEGLKKRAVFLRGRWNDLVMYSATCDEFGIAWRGNPKTRPR